MCAPLLDDCGTVVLVYQWVCADCGYIYDPSIFGGLFFEEQTKGFKCPQCSGPRRRYAKKVGDKVGVTLDGGDGPILAASFVGESVGSVDGLTVRRPRGGREPSLTPLQPGSLSPPPSLRTPACFP